MLLCFLWAGNGIVLDLLHAHRVSFSVLCTCQLHLFAIRTNSLHSCRSYANPLEPRQTCRSVGFLKPHNCIIKEMITEVIISFMGRVVGLYRIILNPDGFSRFVRLFALTGLLAIARHRPTENPLELHKMLSHFSGFSSSHTHNKIPDNISHREFYGAGSGIRTHA